MSSSFYRGADACILVYDVTNPTSFDNIERWRETFISHSNPDESVSYYLIGNKVDLEEERSISKAKGDEWGREYDIEHLVTSAKDPGEEGEPVSAVFE